jgi:hypothetical protein
VSPTGHFLHLAFTAPRAGRSWLEPLRLEAQDSGFSGRQRGFDSHRPDTRSAASPIATSATLVPLTVLVVKTPLSALARSARIDWPTLLRRTFDRGRALERALKPPSAVGIAVVAMVFTAPPVSPTLRTAPEARRSATLRALLLTSRSAAQDRFDRFAA